MTTNASQSPMNQSAAQRAHRALTLAIARYEALSSTPRWMRYPIVGDLAATMRAAERATQAGNTLRAEQLNGYVVEEQRRIELARTWTHAKRGEKAWQALVKRMQRAMEFAVRVGILSGERLQYCDDRLQDAIHVLSRFETQRQLARLN
jgi:hypothetical protein